MSNFDESVHKFVCPEMVFGIGSRAYAAQYALNLGITHILLVSDPGVTQAGWTQHVFEELENQNLAITTFSDVTPNPKDHEVTAGAQRYSAAHCDGIIAVGGGSVIDCAKGIAVVAANGGHISDYAGVDTISKPGPPLICVPTTAGTSADISQFAVIIDTSKNDKHCIISKLLIPDISLIDPQTTLTMDPELTAATGLDAFSHAVEALVSNGSSALTEVHAVEAIRLIHRNFEKVLANSDDIQARTEMVLGSIHAGLAFSNASLGLVHAMAHSLGALLDLPHGVCTSVILPYVIEFNMPFAENKFKLMADAMGIDVSQKQWLDAMSREVGSLLGYAGELIRLKEVGVSEEDIKSLADRTMADATIVTNPRRPTRQEVEMIYARAM